MAKYTYPRFDYSPPPGIGAATPAHHPVIVVGAGMVGLTVALDLATRGVACLVIDDDDTVSLGSRSICQAKRTLEVWDRLGVADRMIEQGVTWSEGRVFYGDDELYRFDMQDSPNSKFPAFINLQQYYVEQFLVEAAERAPLIELRWKNRLVELDPTDDRVALEVETPDGRYSLTADWLVAADGAKSTARRAIGLDFLGEIFQDHFLIADIEMQVDFPVERRFWFDPTWGPEQSALLHRQSNNIWRLDFQLGWDIDAEAETKPENVMPRVRRMIGEDVDFTVEWISIYTFQCRRLERFRHGRVLFIGDAAHQMSPFGGRGGNSGIQDADNLAWKLALVMAGSAPEALLDSFDVERVDAARENILHSTRATDFITPKSTGAKAYRDAVLDLAHEHPFARALVNSGRLTTATVLTNSPLNSYDQGFGDAGVPLGAPCPSVPAVAQFESDARGGAEIGDLLDALGNGFTGLYFAETEVDIAPEILAALLEFANRDVPVDTLLVSPLQNAANKLKGLFDRLGAVTEALAAEPGSFYLVRPDQHVAARWRELNIGQLDAALTIATGGKPAGNLGPAGDR